MLTALFVITGLLIVERFVNVRRLDTLAARLDELEDAHSRRWEP
jgi:hypothetical protein